MLNKRKLLIDATRAGLVTVFMGVMTGCGTTPPSSFYLIDAIDAPPVVDGTENSEAAPHVGIRRVELPEYLARPGIVIRKSRTQMDLAMLHRWAEPLGDSVPRILSENISRLLNSDRISVYPWTADNRPDYEINVRIVRFDAADDGDVTLVAHWRVKTTPTGQPVIGKSVIRQPFAEQTHGSPDYGRIALAHSRALAELSREIVDVLLNTHRRTTPET